VASRFYRRRKAGVFQHLFDTLKQQADAAGQLDWEVHFVDRTIVRAYQHAAGAKKRGWLHYLGGPLQVLPAHRMSGPGWFPHSPDGRQRPSSTRRYSFQPSSLDTATPAAVRLVLFSACTQPLGVICSVFSRSSVW
jgi:hypothetical protein